MYIRKNNDISVKTTTHIEKKYLLTDKNNLKMKDNDNAYQFANNIFTKNGKTGQ